MDYTCDVCNQRVEGASNLIDHTEEHIIDAIRGEHPEWIEGDGVCKKCYEYYKEQMKNS